MKRIKYFIICLALVALSGCATVPYVPPTPSPRISGIYHKVQRGETLWKLSKVYGVKMKEIIKLNRLPNASRINTGQSIFIPHAKRRVDTAQVYINDETFIWPVEGRVISFFGTMKEGVRAKGIHIAARSGEKVLAAKGGKISFRDDNVKGLGKTVIVDHGDGYSTVYGYNAGILVDAGDFIKKGEAIAMVGQTGRAETPSLYFEIRKEHKPQNPFYYLP